MQLRVNVFVVEQACPYPELDGRDTHRNTVHVLGYANSELIACARILDSNNTSAGSSGNHSHPLWIGRVLVAREHRHRGYARSLMQAILAYILEHYPQRKVRLSAQTTVQEFYRSLGFIPISAPFLEDDIEHIHMQLADSG